MSPRRDRSAPGGVGDGLPALPDGEPLLARWFAIAIVVLSVLGVGVVVWAVLSIRGTDLEPAARRPPGSATVTHERGEAALADETASQDAPGCASGVTLVGDAGARAALERAVSTLCTQTRREGLEVVSRGLRRLADAGGRIRVAVFELNGVDSSTRIEDGVPVVELNAKFQFQEGSLAAPVLAHELVHLGRQRWPGAPVDVAGELAALEATAEVCDRLVLPDDPPRACRDAQEVLASDDPAAALRDAGYPTP